MKWSNYQKAIFKDTRNGTGHTIVEAVAGAGKTSSLIESLNHIPKNKTWLLVAFNKKIAEEMKKRAPDTGDCRTLHSLGLRALFKKWPKLKVSDDKNKAFFNKELGKKKFWDSKVQLIKTVSLCKGYLIEGTEFIDVIMDNHQIDTCDIPRPEFIKLVQKCLDHAKKNVRQVDFDDMVWLPYVHNLYIKKYHRVLIDEAQDLNNAQIALALRACKRNGRITAYADPRQAIYSWRGASKNAVDKIKEKLNAKSLPLSITYRCPMSVVKEAQALVPHIEAAPNAKNGTVEYISKQEMMKQAKPGCFILSRTNAPMIGIALNFISRGIPASIQGRDIGANLLNLIKKSKRKKLDTFLNWLSKWERKEVARLQKNARNYEHVEDRAACLRAIADSCNNLDSLKEKIYNLFEDTNEQDRIILSTVHRAKGLERDIVYMLTSTFRSFNQEEKNITYVAITRTADSLFYVS